MVATLLFDGDCAFCTTSARYAEKIAPQVDIRPWQQANLVELDVTPGQANSALQWVDGDGRVSGAAAVASLLVAAGRGWTFIGRVLRAPGVRTVAELGYRLIAANRHRLPGGTPACRLPQ